MAGIPVVVARIGDTELLVETSPIHVPGSEQTSVGDRALHRMTDAFERAQAVIEEVVVSTAATIGKAARRAVSPETVTVEFGLKVSVKGDIILAGSAGEASLTVTLVFKPEQRLDPL